MKLNCSEIIYWRNYLPQSTISNQRKIPTQFALKLSIWRTRIITSPLLHWLWKFDVKILPHVTDKTIKLWKVSERDKRPEGYNLKDEEGRLKDISTITSLQVRAHTQAHKHLRMHTFILVNQICIRWTFDSQTQCLTIVSLLLPLYDPWLLWFCPSCLSCCHLSLYFLPTLFPSFFYLRCRCWNPQIWW